METPVLVDVLKICGIQGKFVPEMRCGVMWEMDLLENLSCALFEQLSCHVKGACEVF